LNHHNRIVVVVVVVVGAMLFKKRLRLRRFKSDRVKFDKNVFKVNTHRLTDVWYDVTR